MNVRLQLLSWNVHGPPFTRARVERLQRVGAEMLRRVPDLVLLQEVWFPQDAERLIGQLRGAYQAVDVPRGGLLGRRGGLLTFVRVGSGWTVAGTTFVRFTIAAAAWKVWQGDGISQKGIQRLDLVAPGRRLVVFNTHLQSDYRWNAYARVRARQLRELQQAAAAVAAGIPVLAAGDLNTRPHEALYGELCHAWDDLTAPARGSGATGTCLNRDGSDAGWRDYVLARRDAAWHIRPAHVERIVNSAPDHPFSDHHGLDATLGIAAAAPRSVAVG